MVAEIERVAPSYAVTVTPTPVYDDAGIDKAIGNLALQPRGGLVVMAEGFAISHRITIAEAAARNRLPPAICGQTPPPVMDAV